MEKRILTYCRKFRQTSFADFSSCRRSLPSPVAAGRRPALLTSPAAAADPRRRRRLAAEVQPAAVAEEGPAVMSPELEEAAAATAYCDCSQLRE